MTRAGPFLAAAVLCLLSTHAVAEFPLTPDPPFRVYSIADGLSQKRAQAIAQDQHGFLWIATFGGLNRFDGQSFETFTTRQGLRDNFIQDLMVDHHNRLYAGDASGGITILENGQVTVTVDPLDEQPGIVRDMLALDDTLYIASQPGGLRKLSMADPQSGLTLVSNDPGDALSLASPGAGQLLVLGTNGLFLLEPDRGGVPIRIDGDLTAMAGNEDVGVFVGNAEGRLGRYTATGIDWLDADYGGEIQRIAFSDDGPAWVFTSRFFTPFDQPQSRIELARTGKVCIDDEGVLWLQSASGLARYLGSQFSHYTLNVSERPASVFAIQPVGPDDYWLGSSEGLLHIDRSGTLNPVSASLGIPLGEVRSLKLAADRKTLWAGQIDGVVHRIDTESMSAEPVFPEKPSVFVGMELDQQGVVWAGSYFGTLYRHDPRDGSTRAIDLGKGAAIYGLDEGADGTLWFAANHRGIYRINTLDVTAEPELVIPVSDINLSLFTDLVVVNGHGDEPELWFTTIQGGVFHYQNGQLSRPIDGDHLADLTMYAVAPLPDRTLAVTSNRGMFRIDPASGQITRYGALDGYVGIEAKAHATYFDNEHTLWIGVGNGVTAMDIRAGMAEFAPPRPHILRLVIDDVPLVNSADGPTTVERGRFTVHYAAVSTRRPEGIEYSYRLSGMDSAWSQASTNQSMRFSSLAPGAYVFEVRARSPGGGWSDPDRWSLIVPTPFWQTYWFVALAAVAGVLMIWTAVRLRLRSIARANRRLRDEVAERTRSIEEGRRKLEQINQQLSSEILERRKSDERRADVEARFHQAYQNAPIGMALVDGEGLVYDANPTLKQLFWPHSEAEDREPLIQVIAKDDRERFAIFLDQFATNELTTPSMEFECRAHDGQMRRIDFLPSAVRSSSGELQYVVLLANDVTDSRAMTRQLEYQASFDELTGLINRRAYMKRLEAISETVTDNDNAYLMFLDLDQFKVVNDTCGHAAGDELLRKVATAIVGCVRDQDTVARLGGDEFAIVLASCPEGVALKRAEQVRKAVQDLEFFWLQETFRIGVSIGIVPIAPGMRDLNELQQLADAACYAAKEAGRNRVHLVDSDKDAAHEHRGEMRWVQRLNHAIDTNSFVLFGQRLAPLADDNDQHERIEILLRLHDRTTNRLIPPAAFLPAAERYGLQGKLDLWVVNRVIEVLAAQDHSALAERRFWVNLSGASVSDPQFSAELIRMVETCGVPPGTLNFEITETAVIRKISAAATLVEALKRMGCKFALDDFGSGLSSFGYLKRLDVDFLKVDGEYIRDIVSDPTDRIFVKSIIDIAHTLDMRVVAEFVENDDALAMVRDLGADFAQGFGVHRPEALESLVPTTLRVQRTGA